MKLNYLVLDSTDAALNLAAEQYVFEQLPRDRMYFMLWQNRSAVIIGKYQNTMAEINPSYIKEQGIQVVRRLSGGGAVYHDMGNVNYTFICDAGNAQELNVKLFCKPMVEALRSMGVNAELNGRNDICIDGAKISGNAQYLREGRIMHHGTVLFDSKLSVVAEALRVDREKIQSKGIKSVRSRVTNVKPYLSESMDIEVFKRRLLDSILRSTPGEEYMLSQSDMEIIETLRRERYDTWDWNYGFSPLCSIERHRRIEGVGSIDVHMDVDKGIITALSFTGDFFSASDPDVLADLLIGTKAARGNIEAVLRNINVARYFSGLSMEALAELLSE